MPRRTLSIASFFCAQALAAFLLSQLQGNVFPAFLVRQWPVVPAIFLLVAAFLLPPKTTGASGESIPAGGVFPTRIFALLTAFLSPFLGWVAALRWKGLGFVPVASHNYLQGTALLALLFGALVLACYAVAFRAQLHTPPRALFALLLNMPIYVLLIPMAAVIVGVFYLAWTGVGAEKLPLPMLPTLIWTLLLKDSGPAVCSRLVWLALGTQSLGMLLCLCNDSASKSSGPVSEPETSDIEVPTSSESPLPPTLPSPSELSKPHDSACPEEDAAD